MQDNIIDLFSFDEIDIRKIVELEKNKSIPLFVNDYFEIIKNEFENHEKQSKLLTIVEILIDFSWEMLNTNIWIFVDDLWRLIYGYSILYKTIILNRNASYPKDELIKFCDLGLLMSGPLLQNKFYKVIKILNQRELDVPINEPSK
jgi:hypothetical protein